MDKSSIACSPKSQEKLAFSSIEDTLFELPLR